jgi:hypothetical protein
MDFFQSHQTVPNRCYLTFFHIPERSIALVKRLAGSPKELKLICPTLTKCYSKVAHAFLYTLMDFFQSQTVPKPLLSYLLPFSRTFNCTSKRLAGSPGLKLILPTLTKVLLKVARILIYMMDFFQSRKLCPSRCYLPFYSNVQLHWVKRLAGSPKGWNWSQPAYANKVLLQGVYAFLYTLMDFWFAQDCAQTVAIFPSSIFPKTFNCTN